MDNLAWKQAVIDQCDIAGINIIPEDPRRTLERLLRWHIEVALDPSVSAKAKKLLNKRPITVWQRVYSLFRDAEPERLACGHTRSYYDGSLVKRCAGCGKQM
jgi:hypothetical protein